MPLLGAAAAWPPDPDPEDDHDEDGGIVLGLLWPIIVLSFLRSNLCVTLLILQQQWWSLLKRLVKHLTSAPSGSPNWCSNRKLHLELSTFNFWMSLQVETSSDGSKLNCAFSSIVTGRDAKRDRYGKYICVFWQCCPGCVLSGLLLLSLCAMHSPDGGVLLTLWKGINNTVHQQMTS